ncbi:MAG: OsmC family protein [Coleofasciculus sp. C2-GNP5-27]
MSEYFAEIDWQLGSQNFLDRSYSRAHSWRFDGGSEIPATASHHIVPVPLSVPENVDPEEAFVASLASCHMLFFLDFAARAGYEIKRYTDRAVGTLAKNKQGKFAMTRVILQPVIDFGGANIPDSQAIDRLHHKSHDHCFIANSVHTQIEIRSN